MKKSITISLAIILAVIALTLYHGVHNHLTVFDAMLFVTVFFIGVLAGRSINYKPKQPKCGQYADPEFMDNIRREGQSPLENPEILKMLSLIDL